MAYWRRHPAPHPVSGMFWKWAHLQFVPWKTQGQNIKRILKYRESIHHSPTYLTLICFTSMGSGRRGSFVTWVSVEGSNLNLSCKPHARSQSSRRTCLFCQCFSKWQTLQSNAKFGKYYMRPLWPPWFSVSLQVINGSPTSEWPRPEQLSTICPCSTQLSAVSAAFFVWKPVISASLASSIVPATNLGASEEEVRISLKTVTWR